ncbi:hypothetical protein BC938DRAFT_475436 [Jimgerdemannia flammicorona]|uniref:Uncharacterized protein n=1 Tax=Jimgerdemannia flammicorona TaxID=994334 RepID=A0A433PUT3_9FUNG|nr:hypothetical protein BC938DRAFT_475436 [Jimgerdemannia flammicorona]
MLKIQKIGGYASPWSSRFLGEISVIARPLEGEWVLDQNGIWPRKFQKWRPPTQVWSLLIATI